MAEKQQSGVDSKATPLEAGAPVEVPAVMGGTFAARAKAQGKQVDAESGQVEDKSVSRTTSRKTPAKKKA